MDHLGLLQATISTYTFGIARHMTPLLPLFHPQLSLHTTLLFHLVFSLLDCLLCYTRYGTVSQKGGMPSAEAGHTVRFD
jgi:hypothetical protein